jgi:hypothetical protein
MLRIVAQGGERRRVSHVRLIGRGTVGLSGGEAGTGGAPRGLRIRRYRRRTAESNGAAKHGFKPSLAKTPATERHAFGV